MAIERIFPGGLSRPTAYTPVVKAGNTVYIAGQTATDASENLVGPGDCEAQTAQVFRNLQAALASVGGSLANLVKVTTYLTRSQDIEAYRRVRERFLRANRPASTLVVVQALARPEMLVEIEAVAVLE